MEDALTKRWVEESLETEEVEKVDEFNCNKNVCVRLLKNNGENSNRYLRLNVKTKINT